MLRAGSWFLHSGIQESTGGVARYYLIDQRRNARLSTEITGYATKAYCYLHRETGQLPYLLAARAAGQFLVQRAWNQDLQLFPFEYPPTDSPAENRVFFFDCGIIIRGLIALWRGTGEAVYLERARTCGLAMIHRFEHQGCFAPILQLPGGEPVAYGDRWSNNPGCYQLKSALAWLELFEITGESRFAAAFETALLRALADDLTFLPGAANPSDVMDRLHAYSYFLEALLPVADRPECAARLRDGIDRLAAFARQIAPVFARSDVWAQLLRLRLFAAKQGVKELDHQQATQEVESIVSFQWDSPELRLHGGYCFGRRHGQLTPFANPVSTAFCMQALHLWRKWLQGGLDENWRDLI